MRYLIGVDIGGTFTDCVAIDTRAPGGRAMPRIGKALSTPPDFQTGFIAALQAAAEMHAITLEQMLKQAHVYHGCTVGTNALVENKTARVGLLATRGHADAIFIMRAGARLKWMPSNYIAHVSKQTKPAPLVPKHLCQEIDERVTFDGRVLMELNEDTARDAIHRLVDAGVDAIAISLVWSTANAAHERRLRELVQQIAPGLFISISSEVSARVGEYERTIATIVNSLIGPPMEFYLAALEQDLAAHGYNGNLQIMSCAGGLIDAGHARALPVMTIGSGPVAGLIGAADLSRRTQPGDTANVVTADIGGTTLDIGTIFQSEPVRRQTASHGQFEYFVPTLDVRSVGAGGGSIIHSDGTALKVGPHSAGARPGPICFGRGGKQPTVTDAAAVLGFLDPDYFFGGRLKLDPAPAEQALAELGLALGMDGKQAAAAALRIVNSQMADAIWLTLTQQGYDPRDFILYGFGGAGGLHAAAIARELGMAKAVIPLSDLAAGWSAFGITASDALISEHDAVSMTNPFDPAGINAHWRDLEARVIARLVAQGVTKDAIRIEHHAELRYALQTNQVPVEVEGGDYDPAAVDRMVGAFEKEYERLFGKGSGYAAAGFQLTNLEVRGRASLSDVALEAIGLGDHRRQGSRKGMRMAVWNGGAVATAVHDGPMMAPGDCVAGPAILEFPDTTILVDRDAVAGIHAGGSVVITLNTRQGAA
ncbi:MAG: hydantoinase/oxoprolinase family protein [Sphingomonadales bacterium]|nr:hydantoinase/oxoprolinase family protein [Sphingomonadales bacterium]